MTENPSAFRQRAKPQTDLEHLIMRRVGQAIGDHALIEPDDRILVAVSGGKDSFALLHILDLHRRRSPFAFHLNPVFVDANWDPSAADRVVETFRSHGFDVEVCHRHIRDCVEEKLRPGSNPCAMCARLRRGFLYDLAHERGYTKIALGHHLDDLLETLMLNLLFTGQLKSMAIHLRSDDGRNRTIRPMAYVEAEHIERFRLQRHFDPVVIQCPFTTGAIDPRRNMIRKWLEEMSVQHPRIRRSMLAALKHVRPSHLLDQALLGENR